MMLNSTKLSISSESSIALKLRGVAGGWVEGAGEPNQVKGVGAGPGSCYHHPVQENVARRLDLTQPVDTLIASGTELVSRTSRNTMKIVTVGAGSVGVILYIADFAWTA